MLRVGITGGIGSGKSTVCRVLEVLGVPVFDADTEAKRLMNEDSGLRSELIAAFGSSIFPDGVLDRKALAEIVFSDVVALTRLNELVHPRVRARFADWTSTVTKPYVVQEAAIMIGTGGARLMDHVVAVTAPVELRIARVMARDGVPRSAVEARIKNQPSDAEMTASSDTVILNDERQLVIPQVLALHEAMLQLARA